MIGPEVRIGKSCKIQNNVSLYKGITIEDDVFLGPSCVFTNVKTPRAFIDRAGEYSNTIIKKGATIGANATALNGGTIIDMRDDGTSSGVASTITNAAATATANGVTYTKPANVTVAAP